MPSPRGPLWHSPDGGRTWTTPQLVGAAPDEDTTYFFRVRFTDRANGWALNLWHLWITTDAGATWVKASQAGL